jgi:hypothetical protein
MQFMQRLKRFLYLDARQGTSPQPIFTQPVPRATAADVERIVRRDFPANEYATAMATLREYGRRQGERECARVQLAVLKLADGSLQKLRAAMESAKCDFRDVLAPAEYPAYGKMRSQLDTLSLEEQSRIIDSDWRQYEEWLKR